MIISLIIDILTLMVNAGCLVISYLEHKKRAATTANSDGSATGKQQVAILDVAALVALPLSL